MSEDKDISKHLSDTLHKPLDEKLPGADNQEIQEPCFHFLCRKDPLFPSVKNMVQSFGAKIIDADLKPGVLLLFSTDTCVDSKAYFLGVMLKKPCMQMLIQANVTSHNGFDEAQLVLEQGVPIVLTSHELFLNFLRNQLGCHGSNIKLKVEIWECQALFHNRHQLTSRPETLVVSFDLGAGKPEIKRTPVVQLPFGLKLNRKRQHMGKKTAASNKASSRQNDQAKNSGKNRSNVLLAPGCQDYGLDAPSEPNSESSGSSGGDSLPKESDIEDDGEHVVPISETARREQKQLKHLKAEVEEMDALREETAEVIRTNKDTSKSSFFAKELGIYEGAIAVSGRSVCLCCKTPIQKGSVRFSWHHSLVRPPGWLHSHCVVTYAKDKNLVEHCRHVLQTKILKSSHGGSSSSSAQSAKEREMAAVQSTASKILGGLNVEGGS